MSKPTESELNPFETMANAIVKTKGLAMSDAVAKILAQIRALPEADQDWVLAALVLVKQHGWDAKTD